MDATVLPMAASISVMSALDSSDGSSTPDFEASIITKKPAAVPDASSEHSKEPHLVSPVPPHVMEENPVPPYSDNVTYRRRVGFGARSSARSTSHDRLSTQFILHAAWSFMDPRTRAVICEAVPDMGNYARLRYDAHHHRPLIIEALQAKRLPPEIEPPLCPFRAHFMGAALISFNFDYGDLVRWLDGEYTNAHRNWNELSEKIEEIKLYAQRPGYPAIEHELAMEACTQGVPLEGHFSCTVADVEARLIYDNHSPLESAKADARIKLGKEEANSYHIAFPRFLARFIFGLFICPISWIVQKGKGRLIMDASTRLHHGDSGAPNDGIPKAGATGRERENPPVYYGNAMNRILTTIWNQRLDHPREDILLHADDIDAAFRRVLYHPDLAIVFAAVFEEYLITPVGTIFGARNSPSWWCIPAELRAHAGATRDYSEQGPIPLADSVALIPPPNSDEIEQFVQAVPDAIHTGTPSEFEDRLNHIMFVDDNICIEIRQRIKQAIRAAVASAYDLFGQPDGDRRGSCLQAAKFIPTASFSILHLGYVIDTRRMRVDWPADKCHTLKSLIDDWLSNKTARSPKEIATLLGYVRHGAYLCPLGEFLSIRLQLILNDEVQKGGQAAITSKNWWCYRKVPIPKEVLLGDLKMLSQSLAATAPGAPIVWSRPIALLIKRAWTCQILSDAAYSGIGGWSPTFKFMWRVTRDDLLHAGFNMRMIDEEGETARVAAAEGELHINVLEFVALTINIWMTLKYIIRDPTKAGGHIVSVLADNTSALSWFRYAARTHRPMVRNLTYLCQCLIILSQTSDFTKFQGKHIPGKDNSEADALSRPELFPTMGCAIKQFSQLQTCRAFLLPFGLLSTIARTISSTEIGESFVGATTGLLTLAPVITPTGADGMPLRTGFYKRSHRGKRSR